MNVQANRRKALSELTDRIGVYALCDLDEVPIYVGQSVDGIRARVRRHLTSARSDVIANRQIDVWEIAYGWAWPVDTLQEVEPLEAYIFRRMDLTSRLMNGKTLVTAVEPSVIPDKQVIQVMAEDERKIRLDPSQRLPRQIQQYDVLVDYILNVKEAPHLKKSLDAHVSRLMKYHERFL